MKQRSPIAVFLLPIITFGIYSWYWLVKTKGEMNKQGEEIPTAWIWLIPFVGSIWWLWKYSEAVEHITGDEKISGVLAFILLFLLGSIGQAIIQDSFNKAVPAVTESATLPAQSIVNQPQAYNQPVEQSPFEPVAQTPVETPAPSAIPAGSSVGDTMNQSVASTEPPVDQSLV